MAFFKVVFCECAGLFAKSAWKPFFAGVGNKKEREEKRMAPLSEAVELRDGESLASLLARVSDPLVVLFFSGREEESEESPLCRLFREISCNKKYDGQIKFTEVDVDVNEELADRQALVSHTPRLIIFTRGQERARFTCFSSAPGIYHCLDHLLRLARNQVRSISPPSMGHW